jgi:voltage-dependent potassium channel beta subunit
MEYRHLGRAGIKVSALSLGSWVTFGNQVNVDAAVEMMGAAYAAGVNFFDNAESYGEGKSEEVMGAALKKLGWRRSSYLVSTKTFWGLNVGVNEKNTLNRKRLFDAIDGSLKRFGLDYVDLLLCHRHDPETPVEETVWAMHNIIERGQALYWGTSEWPAASIVEAIEVAERHHLHKPVMEQSQYNMLSRERVEQEYAHIFKTYGYGETIWSPLASGLLTGKYNNGIPEGSRGALTGLDWLKDHLTDAAAIATVKQIQPVAADLGLPLPQLAIAWCLKNPNVSTVILGASRLEQLTQNLKALDAVPMLTPDVMARLDGILGKPQVED